MTTIDNLYFQYALLYGKKPVLDFISKNEKNLESNLVEAEKRFDQAVENIRQLEGQINEMLSVGKQMIYPQLQQKWEEFVLKSAEASVNYYITKNAFEIMKALHEGKTVEQANTLIDDGHSGSSYNFMVKEILEFSKRGVEFYKGQDEYKWIQRDDKLREKTNSLIKDIEERNKNYEKQLNKENSMEL